MCAPSSPEVLSDATAVPRCPRCHLRLVPEGISARAAGGGPGSFKCPICDCAVDDPMKSGAASWLNSDLKAPE
jgi:hypothetical protein